MTKSHKADKSKPSTVDKVGHEELKDEQSATTVVEDEGAPEANIAALKTGRRSRLRNRLKKYVGIYVAKKKWTLPATVAAILVILLLVPMTRYDILGLFLKETVNISVADASTHTAISGAHVAFGSLSVVTSARGKASFRLPVGNRTILVSKEYYKGTSNKILVSYTKSRNSVRVRLVATGRQVPITVINRITNKPIAGAEIKVLDTDARTGSNGKTFIVLPVRSATQNGVVSASGYNNVNIQAQVTGQIVPTNTFSLTPTGSLYFLSNASGKINVVKTNLDGSDQQTVLAGTGNELPYNTVLLASRDWKYLALLAQRSATGNPELDLIDTSTDAMSNIDEGNATFTPIGWDGDDFIYIVQRLAVQDWQNGQYVLKSFNASTKTITALASTTASGNDQSDWIGQQLGSVYILGGKVVYSMGWSAGYNEWPQLNSYQATLDSVNPDGSDSAVIKKFALASSTQSSDININTTPYDGPNSLVIQFSGGDQNSYYEYQNGQLSVASAITDNSWNNVSDPTYLESPSGDQTFWAVPADGKYNLFVGDQNGNNGKEIATLSDYQPYGWYTNSYLLVTKDSKLYIMSVKGGSPLPVSAYLTPQYNNGYNGYGGGYGAP